MFSGPFLNLLCYLNKQTKTFYTFVSLKSRMEERAGEEAQICFYDGSVKRNHIQFTCKLANRKKRCHTRVLWSLLLLFFNSTLSRMEQGCRSGESLPTPLLPMWSGLKPRDDAIFRLSLLLVLSFALRGFSPGTPVFLSPQKSIFLNSNLTKNGRQITPMWICHLLKIVILLIPFVYS